MSWKFWILVAVGLTTALGWGVFAWASASSDEEDVGVAVNKISDLIATGDVAKAVMDDRDGTLVLEFEESSEKDAEEVSFPLRFSGELTEQLLEADVETVVKRESGSNFWGEFLLRGVPTLLILGLIGWLVLTMMPSLGGKRKPVEKGEVPLARFSDVAGVDEAVDELSEMVEFLKSPERFEKVGAKRPRGALLVGPPGTGKTLLARAVAGEAGVPFYALAGSDFIEMYAGLGARRVRSLFAEARKVERAIIFIDEIDAIGRSRSNQPTQSMDTERENTLISLLNELDGFTGSHVVVLAATNRVDTLDSALTRPGRLDRKVEVPNPDRGGRTKILGIHATGLPVDDDVDFVAVARQTPGMSGADLAQVVNEAALEAARRDQLNITMACFQAAVSTVAMGRARESALVTDHDRRITAWHEAGHTLASTLLPHAPEPMSVTIIPRGPSGGSTWMSGSDDLFLTREKAYAQLTVALAGRAAEEVLLDGEHTQGASGDLSSATRLATAMVTEYGMTEFGLVQVDADTLRLGGAVAAQAHEVVSRLLCEALTQARQLLLDHRSELVALVEALLQEETLSGERVREVLALSMND